MTILFESDWLKHDKAVIHYATKNESFLRVAEIYHRMGVKNCAFHLSLLDPDLQHIDPFSPNLTLLEKGKVARECKLNFWYWLREVSRVPEPGSMEAISFGANRMNIALYWLFFNHVMTIVVILRQTGKTTALGVLIQYLLNFGSMNTFINLLTKNEGLKAETLRKVKALFEESPDYINFSTKKDIFNTDEIHLQELKNKFKGNLSSSSPKQAEKVGRGFVSPIQFIDEAAFIENVEIAIGAMLMSGNAARSAAEKNGHPYGTILATTAGNTDDREGKAIYSLVTAATVWSELFLDAPDLKTLNDLVFTNSSASKNQAKRPIVNITMSYLQLGYDDVWLQKKLQENISTPENIKRDIYNQWLSGSSASPIPKELIELIKANVVESPFARFYAPYNYLLKWYVSEQELEALIARGAWLIAGVDTSGGGGRDDIAMVVREHLSGQVVMAATFNEINLITLSDFFVSFLLRYKQSVMVMERKSSAEVILDYIVQKLLAAGINPFTRLYNTIVQDCDVNPKALEEIMNARCHEEGLFAKQKRALGFITSGSGVTARSTLFGTTLISMLKYTGAYLRDSKLVDQISALVIRNNRIDHPPGGNDDMVVADLMGYWFLTNAKHLSHYGIPPGTVLRANQVYLDEKYASDEQQMEMSEIHALEDEFQSLLDAFAAENNPIISRQIELKIHRIAGELKTNNHVISASELVESIQREKRFRRRH